MKFLWQVIAAANKTSIHRTCKQSRAIDYSAKKSSSSYFFPPHCKILLIELCVVFEFVTGQECSSREPLTIKESTSCPEFEKVLHVKSGEFEWPVTLNGDRVCFHSFPFCVKFSLEKRAITRQYRFLSKRLLINNAGTVGTMLYLSVGNVYTYFSVLRLSHVDITLNLPTRVRKLNSVM